MTILESKNCRKYLKRCYQLDKNTDESLIKILDEWDCVEFVRFSQYSSTAKDTFKIHLEEFFMIHGILHDNILYVIVPPIQKILLENIEGKIRAWQEIKSF